MDYFAPTSLSKPKEMINAEKNATIRQKLLVLGHRSLEKERSEVC